MTIDHTQLPCEAGWADEDTFPALEDLMRHLVKHHGKHWGAAERAQGLKEDHLKRLWMEVHPGDDGT